MKIITLGFPMSFDHISNSFMVHTHKISITYNIYCMFYIYLIHILDLLG